MKNLDLQSIVRNELNKDERLINENIEAVVVNNTVTLNGNVSNNQISQIAENIAYNIEGIDSVENYLISNESGENIISNDEKIMNRLINVFSINNPLRFPNLRIEITDGIVTISGKVDEIWKKSLIQELILNTSGVKKVKNKLEVNPIKKESDAELAYRIKSTIDKNYMVDSDHVKVTVKKGIVKLTGEVQSPLALRAAINSAVYTPGVTEVNSNLKVMMQ